MSVLVPVVTALSFFSEIIIRSNINLITSDLQLSYIIGVLGGKLNVLSGEYFGFLNTTNFQLFSQMQGHAIKSN